MTNKEQVIRNIGLSFDFLRQVIENPRILNSIENGANIEFVEKDFKKLERSKKNKKRKFYRVKSFFEDVKT